MGFAGSLPGCGSAITTAVVSGTAAVGCEVFDLNQAFGMGLSVVSVAGVDSTTGCSNPGGGSFGLFFPPEPAAAAAVEGAA